MGAFTAYYVNFHLHQLHGIPNQSLIGQQRPDFDLNDFEGKTVSGDAFDGKVVLVNFWASWCPPCRREIPVFHEVREFFHESGFEVIGIAIDELDKAKEFLDAHPKIRYPQLIGYTDAIAIAKSFGNVRGGLPYSVVYDRDGIVRFSKAGELKKEELLNVVEPLL